MKKLSKIDQVAFKEDFVLLENIPIKIGDNINVWLENFCDISLSSTKYIEKYNDFEEFTFTTVMGIYFYLKKNIIESINVFLIIPSDNRYYSGDVIIFDRKIPKPFLSDDIEEYFSGIKIEKPPRGYWQRFTARESIKFPLNELLEINISMNRSPEYVGMISLRKK